MKLLAFLAGMKEFRRHTPCGYYDWDLVNAYHNGRYWAHRLTLGRFRP